MASAQMISHWMNSARVPACRRSPGLRITSRVASGFILFLECRDTTIPKVPICSDTANFLKKKKKKAHPRIRAAVYPEMNSSGDKGIFRQEGQHINWIFFPPLHPERIRRHSIQTLNSSIRTSLLTVNFILSAFTWPIKPPTAITTA